MYESRHHGGHTDFVMVSGFGFGGRDVSDRLKGTAVVGPVDPFEGGELDGLKAAPRFPASDTSVLKSPMTLSASALS